MAAQMRGKSAFTLTDETEGKILPLTCWEEADSEGALGFLKANLQLSAAPKWVPNSFSAPAVPSMIRQDVKPPIHRQKQDGFSDKKNPTTASK